MTPAYRIERYQPKHREQLIALESQLWRADLAMSTRYFEWKYERNPRRPEPVFYLAFAGSELVGARGFYTSRWESGGAGGVARGARDLLVADDFILAPEHRNRGLATLLMRSALEDLAGLGHRLLLNLSGSAVTVLTSLAMGWKSAGPVEPIGCDSRSPGRALRERLSRVRLLWRLAGSRYLHTRQEWDPFQRLDRGTREGPIAIAREARSGAMCDLIERLGYDGRIRRVRDAEFFTWRFANPLRRYRFLYHGHDRIEGYLVLQTSQPGPQRGRVNLVDFEGSSAAVRAALLDTALDLGEFQEFYAWGITLPEDARARLPQRGMGPLQPALRARGCPCILVKAIGGGTQQESWMLGERSLIEPGNWDLRMLYTMAG